MDGEILGCGVQVLKCSGISWGGPKVKLGIAHLGYLGADTRYVMVEHSSPWLFNGPEIWCSRVLFFFYLDFLTWNRMYPLLKWPQILPVRGKSVCLLSWNTDELGFTASEKELWHWCSFPPWPCGDRLSTLPAKTHVRALRACNREVPLPGAPEREPRCGACHSYFPADHPRHC